MIISTLDRVHSSRGSTIETTLSVTVTRKRNDSPIDSSDLTLLSLSFIYHVSHSQNFPTNKCVVRFVTCSYVLRFWYQIVAYNLAWNLQLLRVTSIIHLPAFSSSYRSSKVEYYQYYYFNILLSEQMGIQKVYALPFTSIEVHPVVVEPLLTGYLL